MEGVNVEQKKSKVIPTMAVISVLIIVLGILCAVGFYSGVSAEIAKGSGETLVFEGIDMAAIAGKAGNAGAAVLSGLIVCASFLIVIVQWVLFAVVKIIKSAVKSASNNNSDF